GRPFLYRIYFSMNIKQKPDEQLSKTYCHLKNNVLVNNQKNWDQFPEVLDWERIDQEVKAAMKKIEKELYRLDLPIPEC
ncbi:hypothetical protein, partial [Chromohalobacter japonicus]|uniref:hypothetical protein n=2 Tax=Chromohalobacter japonicus TaxID=223900 RepID=UPI001FF2F557